MAILSGLRVVPADGRTSPHSFAALGRVIVAHLDAAGKRGVEFARVKPGSGLRRLTAPRHCVPDLRTYFAIGAVLPTKLSNGL
jgi:hypothetical protein